MNYIGNESTAQTVEHCPTNSMVESERQSTSNIPTLQSESRENIKQQNRLPQIVSARESKTIRETSQTSTHFEFQVMTFLQSPKNLVPLLQLSL